MEITLARASYKLPSVFVGCPYRGKFPLASFKGNLERLPFRWYFADTHLTTKQLLGILRTYFKAVDFCIFDISGWNPNVALEIGLADGLGVKYYIVLNRKLSKGVPANIQGLQRIEYEDFLSFSHPERTLIPNIIKFMIKDLTHPRNIYDRLSGTNREMQFYFALSVLGYFREYSRLTASDAAQLARGTYLREDTRNNVLKVLKDLRIISSWETKRGAKLLKKLFPEKLKLR